MLVFSDFDNTLYPHSDDAGFSRNLKSVQKFRQQGNRFCLATGRNQSSLERVWPDYRNYLDYVILDNGAVCLNQRGDVISQETIPLPIVDDIAKRIADEFGKDIALVFYHSAKEWPEPTNSTTKIRCWTKDLAIAQLISNKIDSAFGKSLQSFIPNGVVKLNVKWIKDPESYHSFVDIVSTKAGKDSIIQQLSDAYPNERIITVGDGMNDLVMIQKYDGYAMHSSVPEVLRIVNPTHIIESVADLLESFSQEKI